MTDYEEIRQQVTEAWMGDDIIKEKFGITDVDNFNSRFPSPTFVAKIVDIFTYLQSLLWQSFTSWKEDLSATAQQTRYGTKQWWHATALSFQENNQNLLAVSEGKVAYSVIDETLQVVKYAALSELGKTLLLKVATGVAGNLQPLNETQFQQFESYIADVKPLGVRVVCFSQAADIMSIGLNIYYDGERNQTDVSNEVKSAINNYIASVKFGGVILRTKIVDAAQSVAGVTDVAITSLMAAESEGELTAMGRAYTPVAGYANVTGWNLQLIIDNQ
jgi:hypothetical protein